ncbi:MAG: hypothetical protein IJO87_01570 [Eggerthellaceae bacterium]|nr:hypothetical protein [Eggerthellaceae bacterium]
MNKTLRIALALILSLALCVGGASLALASQPSNGGTIGGIADGAGNNDDIANNNQDNDNPNEGENADGEGNDDAQEEKPFAGPTITFEDRKIAVSQGSAYHETDLFGGFKDVMPGDVLKQTVTFTNKGSATVKVYLKAQAHDDVDNPLEHQAQPGDKQETVASMSEFLSKLTLQILDGKTGKVIYENTPDVINPSEPEDGKEDPDQGPANPEGDVIEGESPDAPSNNVSGENSAQNARSFSSRSDDDLALMSVDEGAGSSGDDSLSLLALGDGDGEGTLLLSLAPGESGDLIMMLSVPEDLGNEYADRVGEVDWLFIFQEEGGIGGGGDPDDPSDPTDPDDPSDPDDPDDPDGPDGPLGPLPITGDNAPIMLAFCGLILATILLAFAVIMKRRGNRE